MKIAVLLKRVADTASELKIADGNKSVVTDGLKFVINPYDEHAVEEAVKLKDSIGAEVIIISLGPPESKDVIRTALAMGVDSAILVASDGLDVFSSRAVSEVLGAILKTISPDLILAGKQAVDDDGAQVPERVAQLMDIPCVSVVTAMDLAGDLLTVQQETETGHNTIEVRLPAVITAEKGLNTPRYPTLPNIMKAKRKEIKEITTGELGLSESQIACGLTIETITEAKQDRLCKIIEGDPDQQAVDLVTALCQEEKVL